MVSFHYLEELSALRGQAPKFRCFDCKRWIPREELPLRCSECSQEPERVKRYQFSKVKRKLTFNDAHVCKNCVDKHDHLRVMVLNLQFDAYTHGTEKRLTLEAMKKFAGGDPTVRLPV